MAAPMPTGRLQPGDASPSFAQTTAEFNLDSDLDLDDGSDGAAEDLRMREAEIAGGEAFELHSVGDRGGPGHNEDDEEDSDGWIRTGASAAQNRRGSISTVASFQLYTPDEENAVVRKFDRRLVLFVALLYMLSFLDRSSQSNPPLSHARALIANRRLLDIGNARIAGMDEDLQSTPHWDGWYEWSLTAFYISYICFEWMSLLFKLVRAHIYVSMIVLSWGVTASLQAVSVSYPMLIALRALLGIGEAGFTGIPFYLSFFFRRDELAFRTAIFISAAPLATTFASSLAWIIIKLAQQSPIAPWRLLFLIEGFPSVLVSLLAWHIIPDSPQTASYLTPRERKVARLRLRNEMPQHRTTKQGDSALAASSSRHQTAATGLKVREVLAIFRDPLAWLTATMFFLTNLAYSSLPVFLPKILTEMGHDRVSSQAMAAPPYLLAFILVIITARLSDRARARAPFILAHALASALGYAALALAEPLHLSPALRYAAIYPACIGFFCVVSLVITWNINNQPSESRQGGGFALLQLIGQCGPLVGTRLYPEHDRPYYAPGMWACAGAMVLVAVLAVVLRVYMAYLNRALDRSERGTTAVVTGEAAEEEEEDGLVARTPRRRRAGERFRYML